MNFVIVVGWSMNVELGVFEEALFCALVGIERGRKQGNFGEESQKKFSLIEEKNV